MLQYLSRKIAWPIQIKIITTMATTMILINENENENDNDNANDNHNNNDIYK